MTEGHPPPASKTSIRPATPEDAEVVARRLRAAVPEPLRPLTVLGQGGVADWISDTIRPSSEEETRSKSDQPPTTFLVAEINGSICGAAEWRKYDHTLFLNGISVRQIDQNRGLGRRLFQNGLECFDEVVRVSLDVFAENVRAQRWYERLGFHVTETRHWIVAPLESGLQDINHNSQSASAVSLRNKSEADTKHDRFGFSTLRFSIPGASSLRSHQEVGRLGKNYFRITDASTVRSAPIRKALLKLNASRLLLYPAHAAPSSPSVPISSERGECKAHSLRMTAPLPDVFAALSAHPSSQ